MPSPSKEAILAARKAAGLTQELAGQVMCRHNREWRKWESGDTRMSEPLWELFLLRTNQHPTLKLVPRD